MGDAPVVSVRRSELERVLVRYLSHSLAEDVVSSLVDAVHPTTASPSTPSDPSLVAAANEVEEPKNRGSVLLEQFEAWKAANKIETASSFRGQLEQVQAWKAATEVEEPRKPQTTREVLLALFDAFGDALQDDRAQQAEARNVLERLRGEGADI